jgi:hypothetical protein
MLKVKSILKMFIVGVSAAIIAGCASQYKTKVDFDKNLKVDTSQYKTFAWLNEGKILAASEDINPVMKLRIDDAVEDAFITKGYKLISSSENADFAISYTVGNRDKIKINSYPASFNTDFIWGRGYYGARGPFGSLLRGTETRVINYTEGKLAVDVYDVKSHQPVWHGWAIKRIASDDKDEPEQFIKNLVEQVIVNFN